VAFALGGGDGNIRLPASSGVPAGTYSLKEYFGTGPATFSFDFQIGASLTPRLLLGGELTVFVAAISRDTFAGTENASVAMTNLNAVLTFYPFQRGLFLRGGLGLSSISTSLELPRQPTFTKDASGVDIALGVGYAWWIGQRFNLSGNLDWSRQSYGGRDFDGSAFWRLSLGFGWY
jgi:hypothetical protein